MKYTPVEYPESFCKGCSILFKPTRKDKKFCTHSCYTKWGKKNKNHSKGNIEGTRKRHRLKNRPYIVHKTLSCASCGFIPQHPCQLDVDHVDGDHSNNSPENLQTLCANCHRLKTAVQLGWT